jgi:hypothetical protein
MSNEPTPGRVQTTEGYGLGGAPADGSALPWSTVVEWLTEARNYWVCTTRADGRPHAMPVWGLWIDDGVWFSTDPTSFKAKNMVARPDVVIHLESGDEVCVIEGRAVKVEHEDALAEFDDLYDAKYQVRPSAMGDAAGVYVVKPATALVWTEADFPTTATRFTF